MAQKFLNGIDVSSTTVVNGSNLNSGSTVLDVQGSQGQLFSVTNSLTGDLFAVSDISGIPILNVNSSGLVTIDGALNSFNVTEFIKHEGDTGTSIQFLTGQMILKNSGGKYINLHSNNIMYFDASAYQFYSGNATFAGEVTATEYNLPSSGMLDWANGDARIVEGLVNNYSLSFQTWDGSALSTALRLDGNNAATFAGTIGSGAITSTSAVTGTRLVANGTGNAIELNQSTTGSATYYVMDNTVETGGKRYRFGYSGGSSDKGSFSIYNQTDSLMPLLLSGANATFAGNIVMAANATVDGVDISALPTTFAPTNAEQNVQSDWNATSGDAQILNKLNREFDEDNWGDDRFVRVVTGTGVGGADTGDKWVHLSNVDISAAYEKVKIEFTIGSYDDNARGDERIAVLYENHSSAQEGHILHWYKGDQIPTLFKAVKSIRSASSGLTNTYDLYVQIDGAWKDSFTVHAEWWKTHTVASTITYPTTVGGSTPTAGSDDKSLTSRERWIDADMLDGYHLSTTRNLANTVPVRDANGYLQLGWINTTSGVTTATINKIYVSDDNYIRYITPATFRTDIINDYYLPIGGGTLTGNLKVVGSIESRKNIVSNNNYNIAQISSTRTTDDYGGLNKTYAKLDVQTPGPNTDGASSAHGLGHLSIKLADNAGNSDLVQKALLRHDGELILGGFYPQTSETELAGLTIRSRYAGSNRNFLRFQTDHSSATTEWTMAKIYAGDGGNFNGQMFFQVATGSNASDAYTSGHDAQLETAMFIDDTKEVTFNSNIKLAGANPYIIGGGSGAMRIKHTSGETMYIRPDETGALSIFEGANSQSVYFMTQTPSVNNTTNESAQLKFHTRSKQSDGNAVSKYATIKHLTHSIGYNYTTLDFAGSNKSKFNMPIEAAGGLYYTGDANMGFVPHPRGAQYRSDSSTDTGYILIKLPTDVGASPDDMMSFYVDIYDYTTNEMISVFVGGYIYITTGTTANYWYNCTAIINTKLTAKDFNVRFGNDGTNFYVAIGETGSVWAHPSIVVRDFQCSYRGNVEHYIDGWAISTETTTLSGVDETQTGNLPAASSSPWGNITGRPYIVNASNNSSTATTTIAGVAHATYSAAFFDFVIKNGTNVRAGTVYACHNGDSTPLVEFAETSTVDLGDTSDVTLSVDISGTNMRLRATTTSSTWTIKTLIRAI